MAKRYYPAWVHKNAESSYGISFPDVPGCISAGDTLETCLANGEEALNFHLDGLAEDGQAWPEPSPLAAAVAAVDPEDAGDLVTVRMVPATGHVSQ
jgi:predicted RNase H-like HicB family nuclease